MSSEPLESVGPKNEMLGEGNHSDKSITNPLAHKHGYTQGEHHKAPRP